MIWWGFHLWQTVKLFLLSIQIYINCNIYSLDFLFHDTGVFESAVKWRLKRIMYYPLHHSQDFLEWGKSDEDFAVFSRHLVSPYFWWLWLADVSRSEFRKWDFSQHLHSKLSLESLPQSVVCEFFCWIFFVVFFFNSHRVPHFSNSFQVLNVLDNSRNAGAEVFPTPVFNKTRQKQNNTTDRKSVV